MNALIETPIEQPQKDLLPRPARRSVIALIFSALTLYWLALLHSAQAVSPAPTGGYPGGNTAEGQNALLTLTTGGFNTAVGYFSLSSNTTSGFNTAIGAGALFTNTADQNTATGAGALTNNTIGSSNTANGVYALFSNTTGYENTANGASALQSNTSGINNTATGVVALKDNTSGNFNTANGAGALQGNTGGDFNTANGFHALGHNNIGNDNTANGATALSSNTYGDYNTATGFQALLSNTTGRQNTATGVSALGLNTEGYFNTANGFEALGHNTIGAVNTASGAQALYSNTSGQYNTAIGHSALNNNVTGSNNVALGESAGYNSTGSGNIYIGAGMVGLVGENNTCYISKIWDQTSSGGAAVFINNAGKLGTTTSSRRFKEDIKPMENASEPLFALKPVTFRYKKEIDSQGIPQFGLIAEDVEKVNPDLVVRDKEGNVNTVRYEQINAMLLNEFLKEHKAFIEEQGKVKKLEAGLADLLATVKEQATQIEKVSAELQSRKPTQSLARNLQ